MAERDKRGLWKKGVSGNPNGRPKVIKHIQELAREHTDTALNALVTIAKNEDAPPAARVSAASEILNRGYGRAPQSLEVTHHKAAADLTDAELLRIAALAAEGGEGTAEEEAGEGEASRLH